MTTPALVPVFSGTINGQPAPLCNARDLHAVLEVGRDFTNWIKARIDEYGFVDGEDFCSPNLASKRHGRGGHNRTDYHLTLDMAKELAMVENNERGRQVRRYFIQIEQAALRQTAPRPAIEKEAPALPPPRRIIRSRDDLSFTTRDANGRLRNWFVPSREGQWHEHVGIGQAWFVEVIQLAQHKPEEAYDALRFAGEALVPTWNWGHEAGFMELFARWALATILEHHGQLPPLPFEPSDLGIPPREGLGHYRSRAR